MYWIQRKLEMPRQGIGCAHRDHSKSGLRLKRHALQYFVNGAISPAGEDYLRTFLTSFNGLSRSGSRSLCRNRLDVTAFVTKSFSDALNDAKAFDGAAARLGVVEQNGSAHALIMRASLQKPSRFFASAGFC